jgi:PHD/YefM family antitoxin component YafN of YafNO toxin-antitoxin module
MNRAVENHERFVVDRRGVPAVGIMSVEDYIKMVAQAMTSSLRAPLRPAPIFW